MGIEIDMTINALKEKLKLTCGAIFIFFIHNFCFFLAVMLLMNYFYGMILLYIAGGIY